MASVSLARSSLIYEWRRYLAAVLAVTFAGLLIVVQVALLLGLLGSVSVVIDRSSAQLWIGYRGTQSVDLGRGIPAASDLDARLHPAVTRVERLYLGYGDWRRDDGAAVTIMLNGIDERVPGMAYDRLLTPAQRAALAEPGAVLVDAADQAKLDAVIGAPIEINGRRAHVVGFVSGIRAVGGANVLASHATVRHLLRNAPDSNDLTYLLLQLRPGSDPAQVAGQLGRSAGAARYSVWQADDFSVASQLYWLFESGAGIGAGIASLLGLIVGGVITSQTLAAAILASLKEFATMRALGVSRRALRNVVLEQAFWIGILGLALTGLLAWGIVSLARWAEVAMLLPGWLIVGTASVVLTIALLSGLYALRPLYRADPATLLR
ncbi:ABC transporter permease [Chitiniphilus purpureus]|uniref:ABC transporter permease n=1 Tax=Chitiniphilus purpureus TaxID=2981137 RepID=A0ABY6DUE2_9NEIS|nr:ABC transporter permease [Chitiniphilus sp. CD1]UXY15478.1 ABC transporter permease [Chitiniphilus sp. CD1]